MPVGRPRRADPETVYAIAHLFYWDFRRLLKGRVRRRLDRDKYEKLKTEVEAAPIELTDDQLKSGLQAIKRETKSGLLSAGERENRLSDIHDGMEFATRAGLLMDAYEQALMSIKVPGEIDIVEELLSPQITPSRIREICQDAFMPLSVQVAPGVFKEVEGSAWPVMGGSALPLYLSKCAEQFVEAVHDRRFPGCDVSARPSNRFKQLWFVSRALAGAALGIKTRTAINLVGSLRPEEVFDKSRFAKPQRANVKRKQKSQRQRNNF